MITQDQENQLNQMFSGQGTPTSTFVSNPNNTFNDLAAGRYRTTQQPTPPIAQEQEGTLQGPLSEGLSGLGALYGGGEQGIASKLYQDIQSGAEDIQKGGVGNAVKGIAKAGLRTAGDVAGTVYAPIGAAIGATGLGKVTEAIGGAIANSPLMNAITDMPEVQDFAMKHPNAAEDFNRVLNLIFAGADKGQINPETALQRTAGQITSGLGAGETKIRLILPNEQSYIKGAQQDWAQPGTVNKAGFITVKKILSQEANKGLNSPKFLGEIGINPDENITNGNYDTLDTAKNLRETARKLSTDSLSKALKASAPSIPNTPVAEYIKNAIDRVAADTYKQIPIEDKGTIIAGIEKAGVALDKQYPNGIPIDKMHSEKIIRANNAGYNLTQPLEGNKNGFLADAARQIVETNAPKDIPVKEFNAYLQQYYQAADYLSALNGKKVPVGYVKRAVRASAKWTGLMIGEKIGGGFLPMFAGYSLGGAIEHALENIPNPIKGYFLRQIKVSNPKAYNKIINYIGTAQAEKMTRLALPGKSTIISQPYKGGESGITVTTGNKSPQPKMGIGEKGLYGYKLRLEGAQKSVGGPGQIYNIPKK